uniref:Wsv192-like protein n=1 Tax=Trachysalambria curvirostris majanivirus TaxID=2984281 RepID=A0A9C7EYV9_9VIRU|nr:MAG: wsv192-like protein [Trachysalambria curvirostris majanivirus]
MNNVYNNDIKNKIITWEDVDGLINHLIMHHKYDINITHNNRRLMALFTAIDYLDQCLNGMSNNTTKDNFINNAINICIRNVLKHILELIEKNKELVLSYSKFCSYDTKNCFNGGALLKELMRQRFRELMDPDTKIWRCLQKEGYTNKDIEVEMMRVRHLLPAPIPLENKTRKGIVSLMPQKIKSDILIYNDIEKNNFYRNIASRICCNDISIKSNHISKMYNKYIKFSCGRYIKGPQYLKALYMQCINQQRFPNRLFKLLVILYNIFSPFAGSYMAIQCFIAYMKKNISIAAKNKKTVIQATALLDTLSKKSLNTLNKQIENIDLFRNKNPQWKGIRTKQELGTLLNNISQVTLQRNEKDIFILLCEKIAEMDNNHPYIQLLTKCFSHVLGRRIVPNYMLILLLNYLYKQKCSSSDFKDLNLIVPLTGLYIKNRTLMPICGFGSGITENKLRWIVRKILVILKKYYINKKANQNIKEKDKPKSNNSDQFNIDNVDENKIVNNFFKGLSISKISEIEDSNNNINISSINDNNKSNNNIDKKINVATKRIGCECSCHIVDDLKGKIIYPCKRRREIKEEIYNKYLNFKPSFNITYGVCGYKHVLHNIAYGKSASLVNKQMQKESKTFIERESASRDNWYNIINYLFKGEGEARTILLTMSRFRICRISRFIMQCEHMSDNLKTLEYKFNSILLPLGSKEYIYTKLKAGIDIIKHANICWRELCFHKGWINDVINTDAPDWTIKYSYECFNEYNSLTKTTEELYPYIDSEQECNFLYTDVVPIINNKDFFKLTTREYDRSSFWAECSYQTLIDALLMKRVILNNGKDYNNIGLETLIRKCGSPVFESILLNIKNKCNETQRGLKDKYEKDVSRWSKKNNGIHGKKSVDFDVNTLIIIKDTLFDGQPCSIFLIEDQDQAMKKNFDFISIDKKEKDKIFIKAPLISPLYKTIFKPAPITIRPKP